MAQVSELLLGRVPGVEGHAAFVLSPLGDRVITRNAKTGKFEDITQDLGLSSASHEGALGDFNADGLTDLLSWDGERLCVYALNSDGVFAAWGSRLPVEECLGLEALPSPAEGEGACLVSTPTWPFLVHFENASTSNKIAVGESEGEFPGADLKQVYPCVVGDFDGDNLVDAVQPFRAGALFYRGTEDGRLAAPTKQTGLFGGFGEMHPNVCDMDGDGMLDILLAGKAGLALWRNTGEGRFVSVLQTGEPDRFVRTDASGGAIGDVNNDGRQDFAMFYDRGGAQVYFSRGFATFGYGRSLDLAGDEMLPQSTQGQQAGVLHDWNQDGAQDLMMVLNDGSVCVAWQTTGDVPLLAAELFLAPAGYAEAPVRLVARTPERKLGAWPLTPGRAPAMLSRPHPGPIMVDIYLPGAEAPATVEIIVEDRPIRRGLP
jgi:hypothetical protein